MCIFLFHSKNAPFKNNENNKANYFSFAAFLIFIGSIIFVSSSVRPSLHTTYTNGNGRPGCRVTEEFGYKWRNNWDPVRYWVCHGNGVVVSYACPTDHLFLENAQTCVHWKNWDWTPPSDPPTLL